MLLWYGQAESNKWHVKGRINQNNLKFTIRLAALRVFFLLMKLNEIGMEQRYESQLTMVLPTAATQKAPDAHNKG